MTHDSDSKLPIVLAMTGGSGAVYAVRLLQQLLLAQRRVHLVYSPSAAIVLRQELGICVASDLPMGTATESLTSTQNSREGVASIIALLLGYHWPGTEARWGSKPALADVLGTGQWVMHSYQDFMAPIASGSYLTAGMVICPCSGTTLSGVVYAAGNNLIQRAADVHLKEHRKLILVPRETPLSVFQLENMHRAAQAGAVVLPAMPGWYHGVDSIVDLIDFVVARILDHLGVPHHLIRRWGDEQ